MQKGVIEIMTGDNASPELDTLKPVPGDGVTQLSEEELVSKFHNEQLALNTFTISIWGDRSDNKLNIEHRIKLISYDPDSLTLILFLENNYELHITQPRIIHISSTYLKILKAQKIIWKVNTESDLLQKFSYFNNGQAIVTHSNSEWQPSPYALGRGMTALYLQGS